MDRHVQYMNVLQIAANIVSFAHDSAMSLRKRYDFIV